MSHQSLVARFRSFFLAAIAILSLLPACGDDKKTLVLVHVALDAYSTATTVEVTVTPTGAESVARSFTAAEAKSSNLGVYLSSDTSGSATISVAVYDASNALIAKGTASATGIVAGGTTGPITVLLSPVTVGPDGGVTDGGVPDTSPVDAGNVDASHGPDGVAFDTSRPDVAAPVDQTVDQSNPPLDGAVDMASPDVPAGPDAGPDGGVDAPTTMNVLASCKQYTHSEIIASTGKPTDFGIRQFLFTSNGKYLVSLGEDGRAKVWNVTASGLEELSHPLVFAPGGQNLVGAFSPDEKLLALGDQSGQVNVYDFTVSLQYGSASLKLGLPPTPFSAKVDSVTNVQFTSDGAHLVVGYSGYMRPDPNLLVVWDLGTQQVARKVEYDYDDHPLDIFPGSFTGPMWVASETTRKVDGGEEYVVTLLDASQASPQKAQFNTPDAVSVLAFSPDGKSLAVGLNNAEIGLWDISNKSSIIRLGTPLIAAITNQSAYSVAFTPDGKYLASGVGDYFFSNRTVFVSSVQSKVNVQTPVDYLPWSVAFAPDGLALAIGERDFGAIKYCHP